VELFEGQPDPRIQTESPAISREERDDLIEESARSRLRTLPLPRWRKEDSTVSGRHFGGGGNDELIMIRSGTLMANSSHCVEMAGCLAPGFRQSF